MPGFSPDFDLVVQSGLLKPTLGVTGIPNNEINRLSLPLWVS